MNLRHVLVLVGLGAGAMCNLAGCSRTSQDAAEMCDTEAEMASSASCQVAKGIDQAPLMKPMDDAWTVLRVGGDMTATVTRDKSGFRFDSMLIDTPLPVGYPDPTPPGSIDLKRYPGVRRAEASGTSSPDLGMNFAFFPLFNHIKRRDIAMTSPVEMDYRPVREDSTQWTMSFLYREASLGPTGTDRSVTVVDAPPMTVVSIGMRGRYSVERAKTQLPALEKWLAENPQWERAGDFRALYYNGPDRRTADLWAEVQIPIRPTGAPRE